MSYLLMFRSLTYAQRGARTLERAGVTGTVTRLPRAAGGGGCTYGVIVSPRNLRPALEALRKAGTPPQKIWERDGDGSLREVDPNDLP